MLLTILRPLLLAALCGAASAQALPTFAELRAAHRPSDLPLLDREGTPMQTLRLDPQLRRGPWLTLEQVSPALRHAIVLGEDRRFWDHGGIDWRALAASAWANAWNTRTRGASTLTMQLAGLLDSELARPAGGRGLGTKVSQMLRAGQLEAAWSKTQILEAYLNRVPLRGELVGVAAASQVLFGKHASGLDAEEAALLAAMVRGPNADAATLQRRACELLRAQQLACATLATTTAQALARRPGSLGGEALAPHLARLLMLRPAGAVAAAVALGPLPAGAVPAEGLRTTLDARLQRAAFAALRRQLSELRGRAVDDGAVLVLDNASGEVLAWVGSSGPAAQAGEVDAVLARRQPGSTIKPLVYAQALQQRLLTPASLLDDAPLELATGGALYQPRNYDHGYKGPVSVRTALASSLNVPAVRVAAMLGPDALFAKLDEAGLRLQHDAGYHGHALALGGAEVSLLDLTNAYRMLANGGRWLPPVVLTGTRPTAARPVFEPAVAWLVADMLADPAARAVTFGLDSPLVTRGWAAVKTGTSKDMRDNWCVGFTSRYTVGVWVGNARGQPMHGVSGVSGAAPVWRELVTLLHAGQPSRAPAPPDGVVAQRGQWWLAGTEDAAPGSGQPEGAVVGPFGISTPRDGSVVLLDPEIPMAAQRMVFEGAPGLWRLDGQELGRGRTLRWLPRPGRHRLERVDLPAGPAALVDRVEFVVRAAVPRPGQARPPTAPGGALSPPNR